MNKFLIVASVREEVALRMLWLLEEQKPAHIGQQFAKVLHKENTIVPMKVKRNLLLVQEVKGSAEAERGLGRRLLLHKHGHVRVEEGNVAADERVSGEEKRREKRFLCL